MLTPQKARFVSEYLIDLNATQAAIRAGYSKKTAYSQGDRLLKSVEVQALVQKELLKRSARTEVTADRVLTELAKLAFADIRDVVAWGPGGVRMVDSDALTDDQSAMIAEVSETVNKYGSNVHIKLNDRLKALELIGRHLGMFIDRVAVSDDENPLAILREALARD